MEPANETLLKLYDDHDRRMALAQGTRAPAAKRSPASGTSRQQGAQNPIKRLWNNIFNN
ncbi:hypothetical protein HP532_24290 [Pseudomonas sp. CrR25]|nr:hypothetical protein [Pseudomonas sp. CrR25]